MKTKLETLAGMLVLIVIPVMMATPAESAPPRPQGPCDIYASAGKPCVAAHSTARALYATYNGPLYQVMRQSDGKALDIGVIQPSDSPIADPGGYANAAAQDAFCANTWCWITKNLRPIPQAQRPHAGSPRRIQRPGIGWIQQPSARSVVWFGA